MRLSIIYVGQKVLEDEKEEEKDEKQKEIVARLESILYSLVLLSFVSNPDVYSFMGSTSSKDQRALNMTICIS